MSDSLVVTHGVLGWGNRKGGLEAYGPGGRWGGEGLNAEYGDLLGDSLDRAGVGEGAHLLVVATLRPAPAPAALHAALDMACRAISQGSASLTELVALGMASERDVDELEKRADALLILRALRDEVATNG